MHTSPADFPQTWQRPPFTDLMECLKKLRVDPPVWNPSTSRKIALGDHENSATFRREVAAYLATIISSGLKWIEDDDEKEAIWEEASHRLSERCGRAGMGEITRRWPFEGPVHPAFELTIREPPITGDDLGLKTWGSSYLLAQQLDKIASSSLSHLLASGSNDGSSVNVLELGSGTGLLGMAAAVIWKTSVMLTDLPTIVPNLAYNVEANRSLIESHGGGVEAGALTWGGSGEEDGDQLEAVTKTNQFQVSLHPGTVANYKVLKDVARSCWWLIPFTTTTIPGFSVPPSRTTSGETTRHGWSSWCPRETKPPSGSWRRSVRSSNRARSRWCVWKSTRWPSRTTGKKMKTHPKSNAGGEYLANHRLRHHDKPAPSV